MKFKGIKNFNKIKYLYILVLIALVAIILTNVTKILDFIM